MSDFAKRFVVGMLAGLFLSWTWVGISYALELDWVDLTAGLLGLAFLCALLIRPDQA